MKVKLRSLFLAVVATALIHTVGQAQAKLDSLSWKFAEYRKNSLTEKLFVHTDQTCYLVGETLWFSIYAVDGTMHMPLDLSKFAYVEILDSQNAPVLQAKVTLDKGRGQGSFYLPASLGSGNFVLRAYTRWMRNGDPVFYFHQRITIVNQFTGPDSPGKEQGKPMVSFFPEGGNLVAGIRSKVAFRAVDSGGKGIHVKGAILNQQNDTITRFAAEKFGIGTFEFEPREGSYRAWIIDAQGNTSFHQLPTPYREGVVMRLEEQGSNVVISITGKFNGSKHAGLALFGHSRQRIFFNRVLTWDRTKAVFIIPVADIPGGIAHFTVFDEKGLPLCERLYYRFSDRQLDVQVRASQSAPGTRRKVTVTIQTKTEGAPDAADLSIAVVKKDSLATFTPASIFPYLSLSSDLTGNIESPDYYFGSNQKDVARHMDNLMLTHGWRRFNWEAVNGGKSVIAFAPEYRGHIVEATVENDAGAVHGELAYLSRPGKKIELYASRSDVNGNLLFEIHARAGRNQLIIQPDAPNPSLTMALHDPFSDRFALLSSAPWNLQPELNKSLLNRSIAMQVEDIFHDDVGDTPTSNPTDTTAFYGLADETYLLDAYTRFPVMEEVMREYVPGVLVRKRKDGFHFLVIDRLKGGVLEPPMILVDGLPVFQADRVMNIDPLKIKKLEVVGRKYYLGRATFQGIVSYSTYNGDLAGLEPVPGSLAIDYEGLQRQREFYHPEYGTRAQLESRIPDRRYVLYWNPKLETDASGRAEVTFYASDVEGEFEIQVHGLTNEGHAGSAARRFTVNP